MADTIAPDNPPAFPIATIDGYGTSGMDLRDYFAGQALAGYFANKHTPHLCDGLREAEYAYHIADCMLAERAKATP